MKKGKSEKSEKEVRKSSVSRSVTEGIGKTVEASNTEDTSDRRASDTPLLPKTLSEEEIIKKCGKIE